MKEQFYGDSSRWGIGVVEDINDPARAGRVKVRIYGLHDISDSTLPTSDLPWSQALLPSTEAGISGVGRTPVGIARGSLVYGVFLDGEDKQNFLVIGSIAGRNTPTQVQGVAQETETILNGASNAEQIYNFFVDYAGFNEFEAAGILGAIGHELNDPAIPHTIEINGRFGIGQWTTEERVDLRLFAQELQLQDTSLEAQLRYVHLEMVNAENGWPNYMLEDGTTAVATTTEEASDAFTARFYESSTRGDRDQRILVSNQANAAYGSSSAGADTGAWAERTPPNTFTKGDHISSREEIYAVLASATRTIDELVVHHTDTFENQNTDVDAINDWHVQRDFAEIGYHFIIRQNGDIQLGRDVNTIGAHALNHNATSIGIAFVGGRVGHSSEASTRRSADTFNESQWNTFDQFLEAYLLAYPNSLIVGHRDVDPERRSDPEFDVRRYVRTRYPNWTSVERTVAAITPDGSGVTPSSESDGTETTDAAPVEATDPTVEPSIPTGSSISSTTPTSDIEDATTDIITVGVANPLPSIPDPFGNPLSSIAGEQNALQLEVNLSDYTTLADINTILLGYVTLATDQSISGAKTFTTAPDISQVGTTLLNLKSTDNSPVQYRLISDSENRRIVARNGADSATLNQIVFLDDSVHIYGPTASDDWLCVDANGITSNGATVIVNTDTIDALSGVTLTSPAEGEVLKYVSGQWVNASVGSGSGLDADLLDGQDGTYYLAWANLTGVPSTFAPSAHTHVLAEITDLSSTSDLPEGTNLYYTQARFDAAFTAKDTDDLSEGISNFYYTEGRFNTSLAAKSTSDLGEGTNLYYTQGRFDSAFTAKSTSDLGEGTNLYYTTARANSAIDARVTQSFVNALNVNADSLDGIDGSSFVRGDSVDNGAVDINVNDADFILQDSTDGTTNWFWRDHSASLLYIGTAAAVPTFRADLNVNSNDILNVNELTAASGGLYVTADDVDFAVRDTTDAITSFIFRDWSASKLFLGVNGTADVFFRSDINTNGYSAYFEATANQIYIRETDAAVGEKQWSLTANSGVLTLQARDDSYTFVSNLVSFDRDGGMNVPQNLTVAGDLTVSGTTTYINTTQLDIGDNIFVLNADETGAPTQNAGMEIERGTSSNVAFIWNETTDTWQATSDGSNYYDVLFDDGAAAGDAATLDGLDSTQFLRSDVDDTMSGDLTVTGTAQFGSKAATSTSIELVATGRSSYSAGIEVKNYDAAGWARFDLRHDSADDSAFLFQTSSGALYFRNDATTSLPFLWSIGGTNSMIMDSSGNLSIGSSSPQHKLDVDGIARFHQSSGDGQVRIVSSTTGTSSLGLGDSAANLIGRVQYDNSTDTMSLWTNNVSALSIDSSQNTSLAGSLTLPSGVAVSSILDEDTMSSNSATGLATQQSIKAYVDSTTSAGYLPLSGGTLTGALTTVGDILIDSAASADLILRPGTNANRGSVAFQNATGTELFSVLCVPDNDYLALRYDGADGLILDGAGDVGIGTADPLAKLHVQGASNGELLRLASTVPDRGLTITQYAIGGTNQAGYEFDARGVGGVGELTFKTASTLALTLDQNQYATFEGLVGIGTTPLHPLHVNAGSTNLAAYLQSTDATVTLGMVDDTTTTSANGPLVLVRTGNNTQLWSGGSAALTLDSSQNAEFEGNVTIGSTQFKFANDGTYSRFYIDDKAIFRINDAWLRINNEGSFTNGIYCGTSVLRTDGQLQIGGSGSTFLASASALSYLGNDIWHEGNDGSGSGLDADLLDGNEAAAFAQLSGATFTGRIGQSTSGFNVATKDDITTRTDSGFWTTSTATTAEGWPENSNNWAHLITSTHNNDGNYYSMQFAGDFFNSNDVFYRATSNDGSAAWNRLWHEGNDGSGSGLDADTVDALHASQFLRSDQNTTLSTGGNTLLTVESTFTNSSTGGLTFKTVGDSSATRITYQKGGVTQGIQFWNNAATNTDAYWSGTISGKTVYEFGYNAACFYGSTLKVVGSTPSLQLQVASDAQQGRINYYDTAGNLHGSIQYDVGSDYLRYYSSTTSSEWFRFDSGGMDLYGDLTISDSNPSLSFDGAGASFYKSSGVFFFDGCTDFWSGLHIGTADIITEGGVNKYPRAAHYWTYTGTADPTNLTYNIKPGNSGTIATAVNIQSHNDGHILLTPGDGYVGLGTTGPNRPLHVQVDSTSTTGPVRLQNSGTGDSIITYTTAAGSWVAGHDQSTDTFGIQKNSSLNSGAFLSISSAGNTTLSGTLTAGGNVTANSDATLKDIGQLCNGFDIIDNLEIFNFIWKKNGEASTGVIAQEVQKYAPQYIHTNTSGILSVDYGKLAAHAVYEEKKKREALEDKVENLEAMVEMLMEKLNDSTE